MRSIFPVLMSLLIAGQIVPAAHAADAPDVNFKIYNPGNKSVQTTSDQPSDSTQATGQSSASPAAAAEAAATTPSETTTPSTDTAGKATSDSGVAATDTTAGKAESSDAPKTASKVLQGYIRVVPSGTKIPIIMDTAIDSDTSQEGDEFSARTAEDLTIDGGIVVPAGSVIKGRIAQLNAARRFDRSGSVALKFDTVTTPDNRQIPIVANIVAHGGVVHARRGMKDIAIETSMVTLPTVVGLGVGVLAGAASKSSSIGAGGGALIGAAVGVAVGAVVLMAKKGKRVDVRPGDELKIELGEDLRMPM